MAGALRVVILAQALPVAELLVPAVRELGHEPVAWLVPRRKPGQPLPPWGEITDGNAPAGISLLLAPDRWAVERLLRGLEPDVVLCEGFAWKLPQEALDVARLGSVNEHPALLPRYRGPFPLAWTLREGASEFGVTWHRMDAELDTGPILAQTRVPIEDDDCTIEEILPKWLQASLGLLPRVFERLEAGDPGEPQPTEGATWAGPFEDDYANVDWQQPARKIHDQVRAWRLTFGQGKAEGPIAELEGRRVKLLRTSLTDPGDGSQPVQCGDGSLWIVESEPTEGRVDMLA